MPKHNSKKNWRLSQFWKVIRRIYFISDCSYQKLLNKNVPAMLRRVAFVARHRHLIRLKVSGILEGKKTAFLTSVGIPG